MYFRHVEHFQYINVIYRNNLNPKFKETWVTSFNSNIEQKIMFKVMDIDNGSNASLNSDDFLGQCQTTLSQIVNRTTFTDDLLSKRGNIHGQITIQCEKINNNNDKVLFTLRGRNLAKMDWGLFAKRLVSYYSCSIYILINFI
jgi:hypothetical protein